MITAQKKPEISKEEQERREKEERERREKYKKELDQKFQDFRRISHIYGFKEALAVKKHYDAWINASALEERCIDMEKVGARFLISPDTCKCEEAEMLAFLLNSEKDELEYFTSPEEEINEKLEQHIQALFKADKEENADFSAKNLPYNLRKKWGRKVFDTSKLPQLKNKRLVEAEELLKFNLITRAEKNDNYSDKFMKLNKWLLFPRHELAPNSANFALKSLCPFYEAVEKLIEAKLKKNLMLSGKEYTEVGISEPDFKGLMEYISLIGDNETIRIRAERILDKAKPINWEELTDILSAEWHLKWEALLVQLLKKEYKQDLSKAKAAQSEAWLSESMQNYVRNPLFDNVFKKIYKNEMKRKAEAIEKLESLVPTVMMSSLEELIGLKGEENGLSNIFAQNLSKTYAKDPEYKKKLEVKKALIHETLQYMGRDIKHELLAALPNVCAELKKMLEKELKENGQVLSVKTKNILPQLEEISRMLEEEKAIDAIKTSKVLEVNEVFDALRYYAPRFYVYYRDIENQRKDILQDTVESQSVYGKNDNYEKVESVDIDDVRNCSVLGLKEIFFILSKADVLKPYDEDSQRDILLYLNYCCFAACIKSVPAEYIYDALNKTEMKAILDKALFSAMAELWKNNHKEMPSFAELEKAHKKLHKVVYFQKGRELCRGLFI